MFIGAVFATSTSHAQEPAPAKPHAFEGITSCAGCHEKPNAIYEKIGATKFVLLTESDTWLNHDKHAKAVELIDPAKNPLAKKMCDALGIADIHTAKECLSCHANWQYDAQAKAWAERPKFHEFGVSCESCHGPASDWKGPHEKPEWRKLAPEAKQKFGFVEIRNPLARAQQCAACHIGDANQGKVITHAMYAAGHPPLPGVELETFATEMPPHWRHISKKLTANAEKHGEDKAKFEFYDEFVAANPAAVKGGDAHASRSALLSAIVTMRTSLALAGNLAEDKTKLPDFAAFDCFACHHDLKKPSREPSAKLVANTGKTLGRPRPAVWPTVLVGAAIAYAHEDPADELTAWEKLLSDYERAMTAQPFGDPAALPPARQAMDVYLRKLQSAVAAAPADEAALARTLLQLCQPSPSRALDHDAARQIAWTFRIVYRDLMTKPAADAEMQAILKSWETDLRLALPSQQKKITDDLPARMRAVANFDAPAFGTSLSRMVELFK